jgi:hypothetical protein
VVRQCSMLFSLEDSSMFGTSGLPGLLLLPSSLRATGFIFVRIGCILMSTLVSSANVALLI